MKIVSIAILSSVICINIHAGTSYGVKKYYGDKILCNLKANSSTDGKKHDWVLILMETPNIQYPPEETFEIGIHAIYSRLIGDKIISWCWDKTNNIMKICHYPYDVKKGRVFLVSGKGTVAQLKETEIYKEIFDQHSVKDKNTLYVMIKDGPLFVLDLVDAIKKKNKRMKDFLSDPSSLITDDPRQGSETEAIKAYKERIKKIRQQGRSS